MQSTNSKSMSKVISTSIREHLNCREINQGTNIRCFVVKPFFSPFTVGGGWMGGAKNDMIRGRRWVWIPLKNDLWTIYEQPLIGLQNVPNTKSFLKKRIDIPNYQKLLFSGSSVLRLKGSSAIFSAKQSERTPLQNNYQVPELEIVKTFKHHVQADKESQPKTNCSCWNYCYCGSIWSFTKRAKFAFLHFLIFLQASTNISVFVKHVLFRKCAESIWFGFRRTCFEL